MTMRDLARLVRRAPASVVIGIIRTYQVTVSPWTAPSCKYYPSCSHYGLEAVRRHGAARGSLLAAWRVLRCNPWSNGGVDDVPAAGQPLFRRSATTAVLTAEGSLT